MNHRIATTTRLYRRRVPTLTFDNFTCCHTRMLYGIDIHTPIYIIYIIYIYIYIYNYRIIETKLVDDKVDREVFGV